MRAPRPPRTTQPFDPYVDDPRVGRLPAPDDDDDEAAEDEAADEQAPSTDPVRQFVNDKVKENTDRIIATLEARRSKIRDEHGRLRRARLVGAVLGLQLEGYKRHEIAGILGVTPATVNKAFRIVRENATVQDLLKQLDEQTLPIAADNVHQAVVDGNLKVSEKLLIGRGLYRSHKSIEAQITQSRVEIVLVTKRPDHMPAGTMLPGVKPGSVVAGPPLLPPGEKADVQLEQTAPGVFSPVDGAKT